MPLISVYLFSEKQRDMFYGVSKSGCTSEKIIKIMPCECRDAFIIKALQDAPEDEYTLVCLDKVITQVSANGIYDCIENIIEEIDFDIFYLASWADRCDLFTDIHEIDNYKLVKTYSPHGTSCLLFSPEGRRKFLSKIKLEEKVALDCTLHQQLKCFNVYTTIPSLVEFDITQRDTDLEYVKLCKCREVPEYVRPLEVSRRNNSTLNLFWFILVLIIIVCIACILMSFTNTSTVIPNLYPNLPATTAKAGYPPYDPTGDLKTYQRA